MCGGRPSRGPIRLTDRDATGLVPFMSLDAVVWWTRSARANRRIEYRAFDCPTAVVLGQEQLSERHRADASAGAFQRSAGTRRNWCKPLRSPDGSTTRRPLTIYNLLAKRTWRRACRRRHRAVRGKTVSGRDGSHEGAILRLPHPDAGGRSAPGHPLRDPGAVADARVHDCRGPDAGDRHRGEQRDLLGRQHRPPEAAPLPRPGSARRVRQHVAAGLRARRLPDQVQHLEAADQRRAGRLGVSVQRREPDRIRSGTGLDGACDRRLLPPVGRALRRGPQLLRR